MTVLCLRHDNVTYSILLEYQRNKKHFKILKNIYKVNNNSLLGNNNIIEKNRVDTNISKNENNKFEVKDRLNNKFRDNINKDLENKKIRLNNIYLKNDYEEKCLDENSNISDDDNIDIQKDNNILKIEVNQTFIKNEKDITDNFNQKLNINDSSVNNDNNNNTSLENDKKLNLLENFKFQTNYDFSIKDFKNMKDEDFPYYPNSKFGLSFYKDIALYIYSRKISQKSSKYPKYILDIKDEKERENEKCKFRHICLRFGLTKNNELGYFKIKNKNINLDKNMCEEEIKIKEIITKEYTIF